MTSDEWREGRALVIAMAHLNGVRAADFKRIRNPYGQQLSIAKALLSDVNVSDNPSSAQIFARLESSLIVLDVQLKLYNNIGQIPFCTIAQTTTDKFIHIFLSSLDTRANLYVLKNIGVLLGKPFVCGQCGKFIQDRGRRHRCVAKTRTPEIQRTAGSGLYQCVSCMQIMKVDRKQQHLQQCKSFYCNKCRRFERNDVKRLDETHQCGEYYCKNCKAIAPSEHVCYLKVIEEPVDNNRWLTDTSPNYMFYDVETQSVNTHIPVLACAQYVDGQKHTFYGPNCIEYLVDFFCQPQHRGYIIFAFNLSYDGWFTMREHIKRQHEIEPLFRGLKLLSLAVLHHKLKYMDLFAFLTMRLDALPKALGLDESQFKKGVFPYRFITEANLFYRGPMPALDMYDLDRLNSSEHQNFMTDYNKRVSKPRYKWNFRKELIAYCHQDVTILRQATLAFRKLFFQITGGLDCFDVVTLAAAAHKVFRTRCMPADTLAVVPYGGYRREEKQSVAAKEWLMWTGHKTKTYIHSSLNTKEVQFGRFKVDGYAKDTKTVYEFYGMLTLRFFSFFPFFFCLADITTILCCTCPLR